MDTANGLAMVTRCCGPSLGQRPFSSTGDPIMKWPARTTIILGQSFSHSLKGSPGFNAPSSSGLSTWLSKFAIR
jgi:hypothetical protein